uniref:Soluble scavenger receptor cysteine-rich domain-containing protein SSC5D n=1 Tax=Sinocyclocheilus grahami TaxID=75366 RepID=A0A672PHA9_SINGR
MLTCKTLSTDVKLVDGSSECDGKVQIRYNEQWGVCQELYCGDIAEPKAYLACKGKELTVRDCPFTGWGVSSCLDGLHAGVFCQSKINLHMLEVLHDGQWGTVCDDGWDQSHAAVVCREIGCGNVIEAMTEAYFGEGSGEIWMDEINCTGTESSLMNCRTLGWGIHDLLSFIRLINGTNSCSGRVEVLHDGQWGTVCDDGWDRTDAAVVCKELNCGNVIEAKNAAYFGPGIGPVWMGDVQCTGTEASLVTCASTKWGIQSCKHLKDAGVTCNNVKLVDGSSECDGRVQIRYNEQWGAVCHSGWDLADATVLCQELYCGDIAEPKAYVQPSGQIWMDQLACTGKELTVRDCPFTGWGVSSCLDGLHAGVFCQSKINLHMSLSNDV